MQLSNLFIITVILLINQLKSRHTNCAPTTADDQDHIVQANGNFSTSAADQRRPTSTTTTSRRDKQSTSTITTSSSTTSANENLWEYRNIYAIGVQRALDECREKFKWDRWNCPKQVFESILYGPESMASSPLATSKTRSIQNNSNNDNDDNDNFELDPLPSNKELGLTRALIASSIVLSTIRSCGSGGGRASSNKNFCRCTLASNQIIPTSTTSTTTTTTITTTTTTTMKPLIEQQDNYQHNRITSRSSDLMLGFVQVDPIEQITPPQPTQEQPQPQQQWLACDETLRFAFKLARFYLDPLDGLQSEASRLINAHNYKVGLQAVKKTLKRRCKCLTSATSQCQMKTCWTVVPEMSDIGDYLKRQYRVAAKVGAHTARETDAGHLSKELAAISPEKLVFADASPDYCYENKQLGISGTLERYCSKPRLNGAPNNSTSISSNNISKYERDSCDRLCTKCGYKIKKVRINVERQCDCRFVYCCSVECKRCPRVEEAYKCVRHS